MSDKQLRSALIRLAHNNPKFRPHLLPLVKESALGELNTPEFAAKLTRELNKIVRGMGKVIYAEGYEQAKGGGWVVVFDTECAALKAYYTYRKSPSVHIGKSDTHRGWYISVK